MPPARRRAPDVGVIQPLHCLTAITCFSAPANVAATNNGPTYLQDHKNIESQQVTRLDVHMAVTESL